MILHFHLQRYQETESVCSVRSYSSVEHLARMCQLYGYELIWAEEVTAEFAPVPQAFAELRRILIKKFPESSLFCCDRCGGRDGARRYTDCLQCGPIYLCGPCHREHDVERAAEAEKGSA